MFQKAAGRVRACGVDGRRVSLDVPDDAFLVHDKRGPVGKAALLVQDPVLSRNRPLKIAQQRKTETFLFGEGPVGRRTVNTDAQNLGVRLLEFGDISLIRL
jgi:hypothetical protein